MDVRIIHYDFAEFRYASFFWDGFQRNAASHGYRFEVSKRPPPILRALDPQWRGLLQSVCLFKIQAGAKELFFCIDGRDSSRSGSGEGTGYHLPLLSAVDLYFKVNLNRAHVDSDPNLIAKGGKIVAALPFFPVKPAVTVPFLPRITPCPAVSWTLYDSARRGKQLLTMPSLDDVRRLRNREKKRDVFFMVKCYTDPIHWADNEFRVRLAKRLKSSGIDAFVGLIGRNIPEGGREFEVDELDLAEYLACVAESRVAIYIRGLFDCVSFKLGQYLALGLPIVGQSVANNREGILADDALRSQFRYETPEQIVERVSELLARPEEMKALGDANLRAFETRFTPQAVVADVLQHLDRRIGLR